MLLAADSGQLTTLCLLDLTATFDTVHHDLLLLRLERQFDLRGISLGGHFVCCTATMHWAKDVSIPQRWCT